MKFELIKFDGRIWLDTPSMVAPFLVLSKFGIDLCRIPPHGNDLQIDDNERIFVERD